MDSKADKLKALSLLKKEGKITEKEFESRKKVILNGTLFSKIGDKYNDIKDTYEKKKKEKKRIEEEAAEKERERVDKILRGDIEPIAVSYNLKSDEKCYYETSVKRMAVIPKMIETTNIRTKKKGVLGRAVVGGVLLGPLGALGGAMTAGSKSSSNVSQMTVDRLEEVDAGSILLTNKRVIFIGNEMFSILRDDVFNVISEGNDKVVIKYEGMGKNEHYLLPNKDAREIDLFYRGIANCK